MVADLIDPAFGQWDETLVRDTFREEDARLILAIPLRDDMEDFRGWHFDHKGVFSVRSTYKDFMRHGHQALVSLLLNPAEAPLHSELQWCDLIAVTIWYVWWERRKVTHGEEVLDSLRSAQAILTLALNYNPLKILCS